MQNPRLASRYAKSLLDLALERNALDETLRDMQTLHDVCRASREFEVMLGSPVISGDKKQAILNAVLANYQMGQLSGAFINLLISKGREENLPEIASAFISQYNQLKNIRTVKVTTSAPISESVKNDIMSKVSAAMPGGTVQLKTEVDPDLIGGFVMEMEDRLYDASVKKKLNDIRARVVDHSYETKM